MKQIIILILIVSSNIIFSQSLKQKVADKNYYNLAYNKAIPFYEDLCKKRTASSLNIRRLSLCYFYTKQYDKSLKYFEILFNNYKDSLLNDDYLMFYKVLKYNKKNTRATEIIKDKKIYNQYPIINSNNINFDKITKTKKDSFLYNIINLNSVNSVNADFSPFVNNIDKSFCYTSNKRNTSLISKKFKWDDTYFLNTYFLSLVDSITFNKNNNINVDVNTKFHDGPTVFSRDKKTAFVTSNYNFKNKKSKIHNLKIVIYKLNDSGKWDDGIDFPYCSEDFSLGHPSLSVDETRLYFSSDMPGSFGQSDIWYSDFINGQWQKPVNVGDKVNTEANELFPYIFNDETLFFSSDGYMGLGGLDLCYSFLNNNSFFYASVLPYPLNTYSDDFSFYLNENMRSGYFSSNRLGGNGDDDIYFFNSKIILLNNLLKGKVIDSETKKPISNAKLFFISSKNVVIDSLTTDASGIYIFRIDNIFEKYKILTKEQNVYYDKITNFDNLKFGTNNNDIIMDSKFKLICEVKEADTEKPGDSVQVILTDLDNGKKLFFYTDKNGKIESKILNKTIGDNLRYSVQLKKDNYITTIQEFTQVLDTNTIIDLNKKIRAVIQKMKKGIDLAKTINLNPIYFDYGKSDIRPDAAVELDKIVAIMKENTSMIIELGSHTDCRSSAKYNLSLSNRRAMSSVAYIVSKGINPSRLIAKGYGETKLKNNCSCENTIVPKCSENEHALNRRTEFLIVKF